VTIYADSPTDVLALSAEAQDLLFREARTPNTFTDEPVTDEQVRAIYDLVKWAPTSMNIQPLRILLVRSDQARARLLDHLAPGNRAKTGGAPLVAVLAVDTDFHEQLHRTFPHFPAPRTSSPTTRSGPPQRALTARCSSPTSCSGYAPPGSLPAR
jgi:nitroreductase